MVSTATERPPATPEEIWAILRETTEIQRRTSEEADRRSKEFEQRNKEFELWLDETESLIKENGRQIDRMSDRFGNLDGDLVGPEIRRIFAEMGLHFVVEFSRGIKLYDKNGIIKAEIDMLLENERTVMVIEVKAKPDSNGEDVEEHVKRIEILREFRNRLGPAAQDDSRGDGRGRVRFLRKEGGD